MSAIITINALERNIGVSSVALTLGEKINYLSNKSVCILELDYESPSFSLTLERSSRKTENLEHIVKFLSKNSSFEEIESAINFNKQSFKNTGNRLDIIYGGINQTKLNDNQLDILLVSLRKIYDIIVIDYGKQVIPDILKDNTDLHILLMQPTIRYIEKLKRNKLDYIFNRTNIVINNSFKSSLNILAHLRQEMKSVNLLGELPSSNTMSGNLLKGIINVERGQYYQRLMTLTNKICDNLNIEVCIKKGLFNIFGKTSDRREEIFIKEYTKEPLGSILIRKGICDEETINKCLDIQAKGEMDGQYVISEVRKKTNIDKVNKEIIRKEA